MLCKPLWYLSRNRHFVPAYRNRRLFSVAAAAAVAVPAENGRERAVLPHRVQKGDEHGSAASAEYGVYAVPAAACRDEKKYKYPKAAVGSASAVRKDVHMFLLEFKMQGGMYIDCLVY